MYLCCCSVSMFCSSDRLSHSVCLLQVPMVQRGADLLLDSYLGTVTACWRRPGPRSGTCESCTPPSALELAVV